MHFLMTTDVESFSTPLNRYDAETAKEVYNGASAPARPVCKATR